MAVRFTGATNTLVSRYFHKRNFLFFVNKLYENSGSKLVLDEKKINLQSLEDMQVGYISQKYTLDKFTLEKYTWEKNTLENSLWGNTL